MFNQVNILPYSNINLILQELLHWAWGMVFECKETASQALNAMLHAPCPMRHFSPRAKITGKIPIAAGNV
jgi:hypothetical protein